MKGLISKKLLGIPIALVLALAVVGVAAAAGTLVYTLSIPSSVEVVNPPPPPPPPPTYTIALYSDEGCTQEVTAIEWGQVTNGTPVTKSYYVKNTGNQPVTITTVTEGLDGAIGAVSGDTVTLAAGTSSAYSVTFTPAGVGKVDNFKTDLECRD